MANPAAQAPGCSCCRAPAPQNLWAPRVAPTPHVLPGGGSGGLSGGDAARVCRLRRVLSVIVLVLLPAGLRGAGPRAVLPLRCPRKQSRCGSCRQGPRASSGPRGSGSVGPSPHQSAEGPQGPHCPAQLPGRKAASRQRGARPLLAGLGPRGRAGPSAGHMASERSRNEMQPKAGPKTQRDLGVHIPSSHPKETGKAGCLGGPQLAGPGSCPCMPAELP